MPRIALFFTAVFLFSLLPGCDIESRSRTENTTPQTLDYHYSQVSGFVDDIDAVISYAKDNGLNSFNVDALRNTDANFTETYIRENYQDREQYANYLPGENRVRDYSLKIENSISIPLDPALVNYPSHYNKIASDIAVQDPYCNPKPSASVFPESFLGSHDLPTINLTNNTSDYERIAYLKDIWFDLYPSYITGCQDDVYANWETTFSRLKQLNVDTVIVFPWTTFDLSVDPWKVHNPGTFYTSTMDDEALVWFVQKAKEYDFKVIWDNQVQYFTFENGDPEPYPDETVFNAMKTFEALEPYIENRAKFLEQLDVDAIRLTSSYWTNIRDVLSTEDYVSETAKLLTIIENHFSGDIIYEYDTAIIDNLATDSLIDIYSFEPYTSIPEGDFSQLSVDYLEPQLEAQMQAAATNLDGRQVIVGAITPSYNSEKYGYVEESLCTGQDTQDFTQDFIQCYQETIPTELAMQAIVIEAMFEAVLSESKMNLTGIGISYWMHDNILPSTTFPNLSTSIRGKPAEALVYQWFKH